MRSRLRRSLSLAVASVAAAAAPASAPTSLLPWNARQFDALSPAVQSVLRSAMLPLSGGGDDETSQLRAERAEARQLRSLGVGPHSTVVDILFNAADASHGDSSHHFDWWIFPLPYSTRGSAQTGHTFELEVPRDYDALWRLPLSLGPAKGSLVDGNDRCTDDESRPYWRWLVATADAVLARTAVLSDARRFKMELCCTELAAAARRAGDERAAAELERIVHAVQRNARARL